MEPQPTVGRTVHYVPYGTPPRPDGTQAFASDVCRLAFITEVRPLTGMDAAQADIEQWDPPACFDVGLMVANPTGLFFHPIDGPNRPCRWDPNHGPGTWHYPERV